MWDRAGNALKRFWGALSGGKYVAGQTGPVNFENLQPIPVIPVLQYGADDGDKSPKLHTPVNTDGFHRTKTSLYEPTGQTRTQTIAAAANANVLAAGVQAELIVWIPTGSTAIFTGESGTSTLVAPAGGILVHMNHAEGLLNIEAVAVDLYYMRTILEVAQETDVS